MESAAVVTTEAVVRVCTRGVFPDHRAIIILPFKGADAVHLIVANFLNLIEADHRVSTGGHGYFRILRIAVPIFSHGSSKGEPRGSAGVQPNGTVASTGAVTCGAAIAGAD